MIKRVNKEFDETYYEDTLDNGLKVVIFHKPLFKTSSCVFATRYGSLDLDQIDENGNIIHTQSGAAHFLEHKLFEDEDSDVMSKFCAMGCNVNAFTSYQETCYYFETSNENIDEPLNLLLDFVQKLNISDKSVEKEKPIIEQELKMYLAMCDQRIILETFKSLFKKHPIRNDIGGTSESVYATTVDDLNKAYTLNYHPSNMMLVIVSPIDPMHLIDVVKENQSHKVFAKVNKIRRYIEDEDEKVNEKYKELEMDVEISRVSVGVKLKIEEDNIYDIVKKDWIIRFIFESYFSSINANYQKWIDEHNISPLFYCDNDYTKDYGAIVFVDETNEHQRFFDFINSRLDDIKNISIDKKAIEQMKNRNFGILMKSFNKPDSVAITHFRCYENDMNAFDLLKIIQSISVEDCQRVLNELDLNNRCYVVIHGKNS